MPRSKNRWLAASEWDRILVVTPTGMEELRPETLVYLTTNKKNTVTRTVQDLLQDLFRLSVNAGEKDPWQHAVKCISTMVLVKQMKIHDPVTGKVIGKASLIPPRNQMH